MQHSWGEYKVFDTTQRLFGKHGKDIICQMSFSESMQKEKEKKNLHDERNEKKFSTTTNKYTN